MYTYDWVVPKYYISHENMYVQYKIRKMAYKNTSRYKW